MIEIFQISIIIINYFYYFKFQNLNFAILCLKKQNHSHMIFSQTHFNFIWFYVKITS